MNIEINFKYITNKEIELNLNRLNDLDSQILKINIDIEQAKSLYKESNPLIKSLESQKNTRRSEGGNIIIYFGLA